MTTLRIVDTAALREYETMQNYNVTIAWTTVGRSRRGKPKTEKKALQINRENACEAMELFLAALRFCVVKGRIEVNARSLLLPRPDLDQFTVIAQQLRLKGARINVGTVRFCHLDDYRAASVLRSTISVSHYRFEASALSIDLLKWADANNAIHELPSFYFNSHSFTDEMIAYLCFGGRSTWRFDKHLHKPPVSPQFLRKLVKARRDATTRREVRLRIDLPAGHLEVEQLKDPEMRIVPYGTKAYSLTFADIENFTLECGVCPIFGNATLKCTAN
ncbi:hypothetical protein AAVH_19530 [Aphelenchoides avenae]|nr:hypothetical protein AAVH_19530 [Aphelenchus avenae]